MKDPDQSTTPVTYSDQDINGLLDTITALQREKLYLTREQKRMLMLYRSVHVPMLMLQAANRAYRKQIEQQP